ncbi:transposase [Paenibacillus spongiae]|uniref:Transposase n=1 Tax=Paenibacillus spongiae TaxID=2909671 RepID=A0ABY5SAA1_9BACL|nr:transposase [Paenibacillus spongiae]UVI30849.1 transposase [Paenibacillus spongiae]
MSEKERHYTMLPVSGETVEVDGVYKDEWGAEVKLKRGQRFPANVMLGSTEWELAEFDFDNHHLGRTDPRLIPEPKDDSSSSGPRRHIDRGDK